MAQTVIRWNVGNGQTVDLRPSVIAGGIDFGFTNPTAMLVWLKLGPVWFAPKEWYAQRADSSDILRACAILTGRFGVERWWADSEDPREITNLQKRGLPILPNDIHDLDYGNRVLYGLMKRHVRHPVLGDGPRLRISQEGCPNLIREAGMYSFPQVRGEVQLHRNPIDQHNHAWASSRYCLTNEGEMPPEEEVQAPSERPQMYTGPDGRWRDDPIATQAQVMGPKQEGWWDENVGGISEHATRDVEI